MSEALRDTAGKLDWAMLFEFFPLAFPELCRAREFGARHYTKDGKDGRSNWRDSINTEKHEAFMKGCVRGNISHDFKFLWGEQRDVVQDNVHHLAFAALNALMALEYDLSQGEDTQDSELQEDHVECGHDWFIKEDCKTAVCLLCEKVSSVTGFNGIKDETTKPSTCEHDWMPFHGITMCRHCKIWHEAVKVVNPNLTTMKTE